jgi:hypothetical protein
VGHFDQQYLDYRIYAMFDQMQNDKRQKQTNGKEEMRDEKTYKANRLVIPDQLSQYTVIFDMIRRIP